MPIQATPSEFTAQFTTGRERTGGLQIVLQVTIFLVAFAVLFSRRPDAILNAQFWAEDGKYFYSDAYQYGWHCLLLPYGGYLNTLLRLIGLLALLCPLAFAPLVMNLCAMVIQILPVNLFLSTRFSAIPYNTRLFGSLLYLALPNSSEIHANTTNIQWHLALLALLVLLSQAEAGKAWRYFDYPVLFFALLDGPLGILLLPIAAVLFWKRRDKRSAYSLAALIPLATIQSLVILFSNSRRPAQNGATLSGLTSILGIQVFTSALLGSKTSLRLMIIDDRYLYTLEIIAACLGLAAVTYALWKAPLELKLFVCFAFSALALALARPMATTNNAIRPQWELLQSPGIGVRYYFFPMLAFLASLIWMATERKRAFTRCAAIGLLLLLPIGVYRDWSYPPFADLHFRVFVDEFNRAARGTTITIPLNPGWQMQLTKR
jgi:hypothetical protein